MTFQHDIMQKFNMKFDSLLLIMIWVHQNILLIVITWVIRIYDSQKFIVR